MLYRLEGIKEQSMMNKLEKFISKHEKLRYLDLCLRNVNREDFRARVLGRDALSLQLQENYDAWRVGGLLYRIVIGSRGEGFFAEYRRLLNYLYYADRLHLIPYIEFTQDFTYAEKHSVLGTSNPFEYYFMQPCVSGTETEEWRYVLHNRDCDQDFARKLKPENGYDTSEEYLTAMAEVTEKYIRLNQETEKMLGSIKNMLSGKKKLGVHVRLTDFRKNYYGHPVCITADRYLAAAKEALEKANFDQIFLATDDLATVQLFRGEFGDRLLYYPDVTRSDGGVSVAFSQSERENHHYLLGMEVLRDMETLALCDGLVAGKSQVSICACIQRRVTGSYTYQKILSEGYNTDSSRKFSDQLETVCGKDPGQHSN